MRLQASPKYFASKYFASKYLASIASISFLLASTAWATSLADLAGLTNREAGDGLRAALQKGALGAVAQLGAENGFLNNDKVKIELPGLLEKARPVFKLTGRGQQLDELVLSMNRAAEQAVPLAKPLLLDAVSHLSLSDAKKILTGGDTSVTDFFREKTSTQLSVKFLPIVKKVTDRSGLATQYNRVAEQVGKLGLAQEQPTVEKYVTGRAIDGLYTMIGEQEKAIRSDPIGSGSKIIGKVFGALR
ncbi:MAG: DUF4197 domain-containing protein [Pseudomonadota bacterium]